MLGAGTLLIGAVVLPLWRPLLVAAVLAGVLSPLYEKMVRRMGGRRSLGAALFTAATVILILIPIAAIVTIAVHEAAGVVGVVRSTVASEGVEGLCHNSEAVDGNGQPVHLEPGSEHDFKIIKMSPEEKKVGLSIRAAGEEASRTEVEAYKHPASSTGSTIGELVNWKRENA